MPEFVAGAGQVTFRVGAGATPVVGGRLAPGESYDVSYRARVAAGTPSGTVIANQARVQLIAESLGFPVDAVTNETRLVVAAPDLAIGKGFAGTVAVGQTVTYTLTVSNTGDAASRGEVVVEDPMPPSISFGPPGGPGWSCVQDPSFEVTCRRSDSLAPGASWPPITISGTVLAVPPGGFVNTSTVDGGGDVNASNNSATAAPPNAPLASLALGKQVTPDTAAPGDEVIYLLTVKNAGGFGPATGVQLDGRAAARPRAALGGGARPGQLLRRRDLLARLDSGRSGGPRADPGRRDRRGHGGRRGEHGLGDLCRAGRAPRGQPGDRDRHDPQYRGPGRVEASGSGTPSQGGPARWTIDVVNNGPGPMPGGSLADLVPSAVSGPTATVPGGSCSTAGRLVGCTLPPLAPGASTQVEVTGTLGASAGGEPLANGFQLTPDAFLRQAPPSEATPPSDVALPAADVGRGQGRHAAPAARRGRLVWHVRATNSGPSTATKVVVRDRLPAGARFAGSVPGRLCDARGRRVTCRVGTAARPGRAREFDIRVTAAGAEARRARSRIAISVDADAA